ncbi:hypothetical protein ACFSUD_15460 [Sulfitobacter aestuarii]|uniref:HdeA/HdeB family protein n=1 Tax=Sulfitobacter aestuarii TaxID=2161676 RepID=A0ABW5U8A7_9RHOB
MKYLSTTLVATGFVASLGSAAVAQDMDPQTITCSDFVAMAAEDQSDALTALKDAKMAAESSAATSMDSSASSDTDTAATSDTTASDSDTMTSTDTDTSATADTDTSASADTDTSATADTSDTGDTMADPEVEALKTACEGNDDALAMDQLEDS